MVLEGAEAEVIRLRQKANAGTDDRFHRPPIDREHLPCAAIVQ